VLAVKLDIFDGLELWEMVEIIAVQLTASAAGNPQWVSKAETARRQTLAARRRESFGMMKAGSRRGKFVVRVERAD